MSPQTSGPQTSGPLASAAASEFYRQAMTLLVQDQIPFLVGGAYALELNAGIRLRTKDLDLFVRQRDFWPVMEKFAAAGYRTQVAYPHWIAKAFQGNDFIDIIFNSGNGVCPVDDQWFAHAVPAIVLDVPVALCPAEESIWQKAFIMERHRYDGADVLHLLRSCADNLDWPRLLHRFGAHWRILFSHLILFGFVYPAERPRIPAWVMQQLMQRLQAEIQTVPRADQLCQGTLLSSLQYLVDVDRWGYQDARLAPNGTMSPEDIARWTAGLEHP